MILKMVSWLGIVSFICGTIGENSLSLFLKLISQPLD